MTAWELYFYVQTQPVLGPDGRPIMFSVPALDIMMDWYKVKDRRAVFEKVLLLWGEMNRPDPKAKTEKAPGLNL